MQAILLLRDIIKGESIRSLASEPALNYKTVLTMRHRVQAMVELEQPNTALPNSHSETDEMFQNAKKGEHHTDPDDPPRRRVNKRHEHGTYDNDRPSIIGTVG